MNDTYNERQKMQNKKQIYGNQEQNRTYIKINLHTYMYVPTYVHTNV